MARKGDGAVPEKNRGAQANSLDIGRLMTRLVDHIVEALAETVADSPAEVITLQARLYESLAQATQTKADLL